MPVLTHLLPVWLVFWLVFCSTSFVAVQRNDLTGSLFIQSKLLVRSSFSNYGVNFISFYTLVLIFYLWVQVLVIDYPTQHFIVISCSSCRFSGGSYLGFLFCFFVVFCVDFFRKQICFGSEGVARDKLMFGILKHDHVPFQILTRYFCILDFGTKPLINTLLIFFLFFIFIFY